MREDSSRKYFDKIMYNIDFFAPDTQRNVKTSRSLPTAPL